MQINVTSSPMAFPQYKLPENYTTDDMRQLCVKAMRDILSIPWTPDKVYEYHNQWDLPNKLFSFGPGKTYAGLPYANAHTGLFQWFYHYDSETGLMSFDGDGQTWGTTLGTVCANCILWAWSIFCNSIGGKFHSFTMSPVYNFCYPGDLEIPQDIEDFRKHSTKLICDANGEQKVLEAYAAMLPADAMISTPRGHAIMVVEKPQVVYLPDGSIDPEASTVMIQDQRGGFYERLSQEGKTLHFSGRIDQVFPFKQLLEWAYIPVTAPELQGKKPVDKPYLKFQQAQVLADSKIHTNYLLCTVEALELLPDGATRRVAIRHYTKTDTGLGCGCDGYTYTLEGMELPQNIPLRLEARLATGDLFLLTQIN